MTTSDKEGQGIFAPGEAGDASLVDGDPDWSDFDGPDECAPEPTEVQFEPGARDGEPDETTFGAQEELMEAFVAEPLDTPMGPDGLPDHSADPINVAAFGPPLTHDTLLCMEDDRAFVPCSAVELAEAGWGVFGDKVVLPGPRKLLRRIRGTKIRVGYKPFDAAGLPAACPEHPPENVVERWGHKFVFQGKHLIPVRPRRPRCSHYKTQTFHNDSQPDPTLPKHFLVFRNCSHPARRSIGGASMSVANQAVYHCDYRDPVDQPTLRAQRDRDRKQIEERPDRVLIEMLTGKEISMDADLQGIFKT